MTERPIFIIGQPRSGTTMLLRVLNVSPGVRIYGEHGGSAHYIALLHRALCQDHVQPYRSNITDEEAEAELGSGEAWCNTLGAVQTAEVEVLCRKMIEAIGNPFHKNVRWGFKEVMLFSNDLIRTLVSFYPECRIIMTTRNPVDVLLSVKRLGWCFDTEQAISGWAWRMQAFTDSIAEYPNNCRLYRYEDFDWKKIEEILNWVGIEPTIAHCNAAHHRVGQAPVNKEIGLTEQERRLIDEKDTFGYYQNEFKAVYANGGWDGVGSGVGSNPEYCADYHTWLQGWMLDRRIKSVVDAGCGDWQSTCRVNWTGINYTGLDVVPSVVDRNRERYQSENIKFVYSDVLVDPLPPADLLIVKDVIHHLSHAQVRHLVDASSKFRQVLWVVDMGEEVPHGAWPDPYLCQYFKKLPVVFTFKNPPGYPYGGKQALLAGGST